MKQKIGKGLRALTKAGIAGLITLLLVTAVHAMIPVSNGFDYPIGNRENFDGWYASLFLGGSWSSYYGHLGEDYLKNSGYTKGENVYSISNGVVHKIYTGSPNEWGGVVIIKHISSSENSFSVSGLSLPSSGEISTNTVYSVYGHLDLQEIYVKENDNVDRGFLIGKIGLVSKFPTPHLHFEIKNQAAIDSDWESVGHGYSGTDNSAPNRYKPSRFIETNRPASWNFNTPTNTEGWIAHNVAATSVAPDGRYRIDPNRFDPWIQHDGLSLDTNGYDAIEINMASNAPNGVGQVYFTTTASPSYNDDKHVEFYVINSGINIGSWRTYTIYMKNHPLWKGTITGIRIDPAAVGKEGTTDTDTIGFDWIKVVKTDKKPSITASDLDYSVYSPGNTINFKYWISNPFANDIPDTKLYAAIRKSGTSGSWIEDSSASWSNVMTLSSASYYEVKTYDRAFQLPLLTTSPGSYDVHLRIFNQNTNDLYDYEYLTSAFTVESSTPIIIDPTPTQTVTPTPTPIYNPPPPTPTPTPTPTPIPAEDVNQDGVIDISDLIIIAQHLGENGTRSDVNSDGKVDVLDFVRVAQNII